MMDSLLFEMIVRKSSSCASEEGSTGDYLEFDDSPNNSASPSVSMQIY